MCCDPLQFRPVVIFCWQTAALKQNCLGMLALGRGWCRVQTCSLWSRQQFKAHFPCFQLHRRCHERRRVTRRLHLTGTEAWGHLKMSLSYWSSWQVVSKGPSSGCTDSTLLQYWELQYDALWLFNGLVRSPEVSTWLVGQARAVAASQLARPGSVLGNLLQQSSSSSRGKYCSRKPLPLRQCSGTKLSGMEGGVVLSFLLWSSEAVVQCEDNFQKTCKHTNIV